MQNTIKTSGFPLTKLIPEHHWLIDHIKQSGFLERKENFYPVNYTLSNLNVVCKNHFVSGRLRLVPDHSHFDCRHFPILNIWERKKQSVSDTLKNFKKFYFNLKNVTLHYLSLTTINEQNNQKPAQFITDQRYKPGTNIYSQYIKSLFIY